MTTYDSTTVYDAGSLTYDGNTLGLANLPVVGVFIAFDDGPYVADPDWVEVTDYVREVAIRRGRQDDLQQFPAGSASVVLDNRDRLFDPFNTAGTYYNKLKPRRQIKIVGQWAGVNYPLFRGFVAGWPVEYSEGGKDSTVTIDCFDALGLLATELAPTEWITDWALANNALHYYKMDEPISVTQSTSVIATLPQQIKDYGTSAFNFESYINYVTQKPSLFPSLPSSALDISALAATFRALGTARSFSVGFVASLIPTIGVNKTFVNLADGVQMSLSTIAGGVLRVQIITASGGTNTTFFNTTYQLDTQPHMYLMCWNNATSTITFYIDGVSVAGTVTTGSTTSPTQKFTNLFAGVYQYMFMVETVISQTDAEYLYRLCQGQIIESSQARFNRFMAKTDLPAALYATPEPSTNTLAQINTGSAITNEIQATAVGEGGAVFVNASGVVTFATNNYPFGQTRSNTSQVTFTDTGTGVYYDASGVRLMLDADQIANRVDVTFTGGGIASASDSSSIAENGLADLRIDSQMSTFAQAQDLATELVSIYDQPKIRVEPFLVKGQRNPSYDWPRLLALDLLDRFTFVRTPSVGSAISKPMLLQSIEHRFTPGTWETIINGSARYTGWFVLDSSLLDGEDVLL